MENLRILAIHEAKVVNKQHIKNLRFFFDNSSIDEKSEVKVEKHSLVAEMKL